MRADGSRHLHHRFDGDTINNFDDLPTNLADETLTRESRIEALSLLASIFTVAGCCLIYELLLATISSYLLGNSVAQFSIAIGLFVGSMGIGAQVSQLIKRNLLGIFIIIEIILALLGGASVLLLFWVYQVEEYYWFTLISLIALIGGLIGLELPLLTRLLKKYGALRTIIANALSFDYLGGLVGSLLFPFLLLPWLGLTRTGIVVGLINLAVAIWTTLIFKKYIVKSSWILAAAGLACILLTASAIKSETIIHILESRLYQDEIIYTKQTQYQRIVVTRWRDDFRLYLDGNLQFSSIDEYRYHESLVHPAMSLMYKPERVLVLGGGDGLAIRELIKYENIKFITLVDLDPVMTDLGTNYPPFKSLNNNALSHDKVRIVNQDAFKFLEDSSDSYDVIIADLPDPNNESLAKLYSVQFYTLVKKRLSAQGYFVTQATSPYFAPEAFWCIAESIKAVGLNVQPYHAYVPSFGDWGFVMASRVQPKPTRIKIPVPVNFLSQDTVPALFQFPKDMSYQKTKPSTLNSAVILDYYNKGWRTWE